MTAVLLTAYAAGLVATVNPCGFAMLPVYLSWFLGIDDEHAGVGQALRIGLAVGGGFLLVFGIAGTLLVAGLRIVVDIVPWAALLVGVGLIVYGVLTWTGRRVRVPLPRSRRTREDRSGRSAFAFGVSYAVASLSCTMPIFLSLVAAGFTRDGILVGALAFVAYGLGTITLLVVITVAIASGRDGVTRRVRRLGAHLDRIAGALLVAGGVFVVWYWTTILTIGPRGLGIAGRIVDAASRAATTLIGRVPLVTAALALLVVLLVVGRSRFGSRPTAEAPSPPEGAGRREDDLLP